MQRERVAILVATVAVLTACSGKRESPVAAPVKDAGVVATAKAIVAPPRGPYAPTYALAPGRGGCVRTAGGAIQCWGWAAPTATRMQWVPTKLDVSAVPSRGVANAADGRCAWSDAGDVTCWGENVQHPVHVIEGLHDVVEVTGSDPACARRRDGTVACWRPVSIYADTPPHEVVVEIPVTGAVELAAARLQSCARTASGAVMCWSGVDPASVHAMPDVFGALSLAVIPNDGERPGSANDVMVALMADGALVAWETATNAPRMLPPLPRGDEMARIVAVRGTVCGLGAGGGGVACAQEQATGMAGARASEPIVPPDLEGVVDLVDGVGVTCAALRDRRVACWGHRGFLGDGDHEVRMDPIVVPGLDQVAQLAGRAGGPMCARHDDGRVECWGWVGPSSPARDGRPAIVEGVAAVEIATTYRRGCARSAKNVVTCWGESWGPDQRWTWHPPAVVKALVGATALFGHEEAICGIVKGVTTCDRELPDLPMPSRTFDGLWTATSYRTRLTCMRDASGVRCFRDAEEKGDWRPTDELGDIADARDLIFGDGMIAIVAHRDGSVWRSDHGVTGPVAGVSGAIALASSGDLDDPEGELCALRASGSITCWTPDGTVRALPGLDDAVELVGTMGSKCARRKNGTVMCWGNRAMLGVGASETATRREPSVLASLRI